MKNITYLFHSGILVETPRFYLVFDYYTENGKINSLDTFNLKDKETIVFVSHAHGDHYDKRIFDLRNRAVNIKYIISDDCAIHSKNNDIIMVQSGMEYTIDGIKIKTLESTDAGVAFLVLADGISIYHAGDLNWWHWNGETDEFNYDMAKMYTEEIDKLKNIHIDLAFVPVDPRLEENYILAMDYVLKTLDVEYAFPIHFWEDYALLDGIYKDERSVPYRDKIVSIKRCGESFKL